MSSRSDRRPRRRAQSSYRSDRQRHSGREPSPRKEDLSRPARRLARSAALEPSEKQPGERYIGRRAAVSEFPSRWLMTALILCMATLIMLIASQLGPFPASSALQTPPPTPTAFSPSPTPEPTPTPTPEPTPTPTLPPQPDYSLPVPLGEAADAETWFQDAVFIGDSRVDGLHLYSGIKGAAFLDHIGMTVYEVMEDKAVIRRGEEKISVLDALRQKTYGKIYIALGVNELGYFKAQGFADTMGQLVDKLRELQPQATIYIQSIIPVNTAKCEANEQRYYVTNEAIASYNEALASMAAEKEVWLLSPPDELLDEDGEVKTDLSADGVHFKKEGYTVWLDYLLAHTGQEFMPPQD